MLFWLFSCWKNNELGFQQDLNEWIEKIEKLDSKENNEIIPTEDVIEKEIEIIKEEDLYDENWNLIDWGWEKLQIIVEKEWITDEKCDEIKELGKLVVSKNTKMSDRELALYLLCSKKDSDERKKEQEQKNNLEKAWLNLKVTLSQFNQLGLGMNSTKVWELLWWICPVMSSSIVGEIFTHMYTCQWEWDIWANVILTIQDWVLIQKSQFWLK